jgi:hypothetical protein
MSAFGGKAPGLDVGSILLTKYWVWGRSRQIRSDLKIGAVHSKKL